MTTIYFADYSRVSEPRRSSSPANLLHSCVSVSVAFLFSLFLRWERCHDALQIVNDWSSDVMICKLSSRTLLKLIVLSIMAFSRWIRAWFFSLTVSPWRFSLPLVCHYWALKRAFWVYFQKMWICKARIRLKLSLIWRLQQSFSQVLLSTFDKSCDVVEQPRELSFWKFVFVVLFLWSNIVIFFYWPVCMYAILMLTAPS